MGEYVFVAQDVVILLIEFTTGPQRSSLGIDRVGAPLPLFCRVCREFSSLPSSPGLALDPVRSESLSFPGAVFDTSSPNGFNESVSPFWTPKGSDPSMPHSANLASVTDTNSAI